ncbi:MAG: Response regulator containing a CheY-like receiver domain and an DNA-binding domain [Frankiales bacterium]|nr:Response regulator containing a CheY-like receiver domain and an DNA-binding domain [Frankiales bacterium]
MSGPVAAGHVGPAGTADAVVRDTLRSYVRRSSLPILLMSLGDVSTVEVSDPFTTFVGRDREECLATSPPDFTQEPQASASSLGLVRSGVLDGYTRRTRLRRPDGKVIELDVRVNACTAKRPRELAVVTAMPLDVAAARDALESAWNVGTVVLGTLTADGVVDRVGADAAGLLPMSAQQMVGQSLLIGVHPEDAGLVLLLAAQASGRQVSLTGRIRMRTRDRGWAPFRLSLQPLTAPAAEAGGFAFALALAQGVGEALDGSHDVATGDEPVGELEAMSAMNAANIGAAGAAAWLSRSSNLLSAPETATLTHREMEIVGRLATGQRVPFLARELFLSESTVRNHLTSVFRKFRVSSQGELMEKLRRL